MSKAESDLWTLDSSKYCKLWHEDLANKPSSGGYTTKMRVLPLRIPACVTHAHYHLKWNVFVKEYRMYGGWVNNFIETLTSTI